MTLEQWNTFFQIASAVVLGVTFAVGAGALWTSYRVGRQQDERIALAQRGAAEANARAAEANEKAEKERLARAALERRTAVRALSVEEWKSLSTLLARFRGQSADVVIFPVTFESNFIAGSVAGILGNAGWTVGPVQRLAEPPNNMLVQGIYIQATADAESQAAGAALFDALKTTVASGVWNPAPLRSGPPRVWIFVGDRPTPLSSWVRE